MDTTTKITSDRPSHSECLYHLVRTSLIGCSCSLSKWRLSTAVPYHWLKIRAKHLSKMEDDVTSFQRQEIQDGGLNATGRLDGVKV